ncbi:MAG: hypothetical protein JRJ13_18815 [Deltaproteobacteria bacterium]|nr:hypothetical protein [Deltaproteobacteria bacterium]
MAVEEIVCNLGIIPLGGVLEEAVTKRFLELVPAGHGRMLSIKGSGCQVGCTYFCNDIK